MQKARNVVMASASLLAASYACAQSTGEATPLNVSMFKIVVGIIIVVAVIRVAMRVMNR